MTAATEGNLRIAFPAGATVRKFDEEPGGPSHPMKAVDFVVELGNRVLFIEIKDPQNPRAPERNTEEYVDNFIGENLDEDIIHKFRNSFIREWAGGNIDEWLGGKQEKPLYFFLLFAFDGLDRRILDTRTATLRRKLPVRKASPKTWKRYIAEDCAVFNIVAWNRHLPDCPVERLG